MPPLTDRILRWSKRHVLKSQEGDKRGAKPMNSKKIDTHLKKIQLCVFCDPILARGPESQSRKVVEPAPGKLLNDQAGS